MPSSRTSLTPSARGPAFAVVGALAVAVVVNFAVPGHHALVHALEAFAAALSAFWVTRLSVVLQRREQELAVVRTEATRAARLAAVTSLSVGAAHELSSPLSTIAVVARELELSAGRESSSSPNALADAQLIASEVKRCRAILDRMLGGSADALEEVAVATDPAQFVDDVLARLTEAQRARVDVRVDDGTLALVWPRTQAAQVVAGLVDNALHASAPNGRVLLAVGDDDHGTQVLVRDHGVGMAADVVTRVGEPFFTTKEPGQGMGLGVFLARLFAERMGGALVVTSRIGQGTTVMLDVPRARPA